jgi:hypothetical protein
MAQTPACEPDKSEPPAVLADSRFRRSNGSQAAVAVGMPFADALVAVDFVSDRIQAAEAAPVQPTEPSRTTNFVGCSEGPTAVQDAQLVAAQASISAVSMQMLTTRANSRTMACGPVLGCCSNRF